MSDNNIKAMYLPSGFTAMDVHERKRFFKENADKIEEQRSVTRKLSDDQKLDYKDQLAQESIKLQDLQEEKKEITKDFNERIKEVKHHINPVIESLKSGYESVIDDVYWLFDQEEGRAVGFTIDGTIVDDRRLRPDERQSRIKTINAVGE